MFCPLQLGRKTGGVKIKRPIYLFLLLLFISATTSQAGILIHFDQDQYTVLVGESAPITVILDADDQTAGEQTVTDGLLSMGLSVSFDPAVAGLPNLPDDQVIQLPDGLSSDGLFGNPLRVVDEVGFAKVKAAARLDQDVYRGEDRGDGVLEMRLMTVLFTGVNEGQSTLGLDLFTTRANEKVLVDGIGGSFDEDSDLRFGSAIFNVVIPEPSTFGLLLVGGCACLLRVRRINN